MNTLALTTPAVVKRADPGNTPRKRTYTVMDGAGRCATVYAHNRGFGADYWEVIAQDGADRSSGYSAADMIEAAKMYEAEQGANR